MLTFDDGPGATLTPQLLELLAAYSATATFFPLGRNVHSLPDIVNQITGGGHELGTHGYAHPHAWTAAPWRISRDVHEGFASVKGWVPAASLYRPPYGKLTLPGWIAARHHGARPAWWTIDSGDTFAQLPDSAEIANLVAREGGGVVLLHDFDRSAQRMHFVCRVTELLLRTAQREGIQSRTYSGLLTASELPHAGTMPGHGMPMPNRSGSAS